jgi:ankyrin repeat protein
VSSRKKPSQTTDSNKSPEVSATVKRNRKKSTVPAPINPQDYQQLQQQLHQQGSSEMVYVAHPQNPALVTPIPYAAYQQQLQQQQQHLQQQQQQKQELQSGFQMPASKKHKSSATGAADESKPKNSERYRASLMAMFLTDNPLAIPEFLLVTEPPVDLDVNVVIDDQGHTAIHWASALSRLDILRLLIGKGGNVMAVNFQGESALIRCVLVTNNYDSQTFPQLLSMLAPSLEITDSQKRSVLHHIALVRFYC